MKEIFITSNSLTKHTETFYSVDSNWFQYFKEYKISILPNNKKLLNNYLQSSTPKVIILSGGGNIQSNKLSKEDFDPNRELVEESLIDFAIKENIPLIAVCRGMQKVITYLEKDVNFSKNKIKINESYNLNKCITNTSLLKGKRTCYNNYSIITSKAFENNWINLCIDKNNNILCAEHRNRKILTFMWHPERDFSDLKIIKSFLD